MISKVKSCALHGIDGYIVEVEVDLSSGIPGFEIVGLADIAVRESKERIRAALKNTGLEYPLRKITVNLAPANRRKEGSSFDLPIAVSLLSASDISLNKDLMKYAFIGELSLDGIIRPVKGVLPMAMKIKDEGIEYLIVPIENCDEAAVVEGLKVIGVKSLNELLLYLTGTLEILPYKVNLEELFNNVNKNIPDFSEVKGQKSAKRALEVAASGGHNCMMTGSPGSGKTMLARRLPGILPSMTFAEALEVTKIHSTAGILNENSTLVNERPFRSPHHTITSTSLAGGGKYPKPGEISLAHYGVLFLDEVPEFSREALEVLRQPLEDGQVCISRLHGSFTYPSNVTLVCASNPCRCGYLLEKSKRCTCTPLQVKQYMSRLSQPLLDRIDIYIEIPSVKYSDLDQTSNEESSNEIRERVNMAKDIQLERYQGKGIFSNSQLQGNQINKYCIMDKKSKELLKNAFEKLSLSARAHSRILKVSRTIADMEKSEVIMPQHMAEAIQYRNFER